MENIGHINPHALPRSERFSWLWKDQRPEMNIELYVLLTSVLKCNFLNNRLYNFFKNTCN